MSWHDPDFSADRKVIATNLWPSSPITIRLPVFVSAHYIQSLVLNSLIMFAFRRAAARAFASPSLSASFRPLPRSQTIRTYSLVATKHQSISSALSFQRRFASDDSTSPAETRAEPEADGQVLHSESEIENPSASAQQEATIPQAVSQAATSTQQAVEESGAPQAVQDAAATVTGAATSAAAAASAPISTQIFVGNLFYHVDEAGLAKEFEQFGTVVNSKITRDPRGLSKGFGFVEFADTESSSRAIAEAHNRMFEGRMMSVQPANNRAHKRAPGAGEYTPKPRGTPTRTLWIGNLSYDMSDTDLNNLFRPLKNVIDVRVAIDRRTGQARGFAHADFIDAASASEAADHLETQVINGRQLRVDYGVTYRGERQDRQRQ